MTVQNDNMKAVSYLIALAEDEERDKKHVASMSRVAQMFGVNRSTVYRSVVVYQERGFLDRNYKLTDQGREWIAEYKTHKDRLESWLLHNQIDQENAQLNTYAILHACTEDVISVLCNKGSGCMICDHWKTNDKNSSWRGMKGEQVVENLKKWFPDGKYRLHYAFLKEHLQSAVMDRSMANDGFEYPAVLEVKNGDGAVYLKRKVTRQQAAMGEWHEGMAAFLKYEQSAGLREARMVGEYLEVPLSAFWVSYEEDYKRIRGMARVIMGCSAGERAMPESPAFLEVWAVRA